MSGIGQYGNAQLLVAGAIPWIFLTVRESACNLLSLVGVGASLAFS